MIVDLGCASHCLYSQQYSVFGVNSILSNQLILYKYALYLSWDYVWISQNTTPPPPTSLLPNQKLCMVIYITIFWTQRLIVFLHVVYVGQLKRNSEQLWITWWREWWRNSLCLTIMVSSQDQHNRIHLLYSVYACSTVCVAPSSCNTKCVYISYVVFHTMVVDQPELAPCHCLYLHCCILYMSLLCCHIFISKELG